MKTEWPESWTGNTQINCDEAGVVTAQLSLDGSPGPVHKHNLEAIISRWPQLWSEVRRIVPLLITSSRLAPANWSSIFCLYISLPDAPIEDDQDWDIGVVFEPNGTLWSVPFRGWKADEDHAQPIW